MRIAFCVTTGVGLLMPYLSVAADAVADSRVEFRECPKCDKRIRIDLVANKAFVNLSRLEGIGREEAAARAVRLLSAAKIPRARDPKIRPLMGWSSWNTFGVDISERLILETAQAMVTNGLATAGYVYVNIDDGFFWGHGPDGVLRFHPERFPNGMKPVVDGIHAMGLKAGIYSDAGADTCGSMCEGGPYGKDAGGRGGGLYGHDEADCDLHFKQLGFDFIKVDYCGGRSLKLDEKKRYTEISQAIQKTGRTDVRLNICRWAFPGTWAADIAESWRTTGDIRANWKSVKKLIGENLYLSAYASPGHYNDMDMLEVGQRKGLMKSVFGKQGDVGLTRTEEVTHFGVWCMLSSPLLLGCDVRTISPDSWKLVTNPYLLAMNQNDLGVQGYVASRTGTAYVLVKDAYERFGLSRYIALYNAGDEKQAITVRARDVDLGGAIAAFDLVEQADVGSFTNEVTVDVEAHGARFFLFDAEYRLMREVYEAESAYLTEYQELRNPKEAGTPELVEMHSASGGVIVGNLGGRKTNDLIWREVNVLSDGDYAMTVRYLNENGRRFCISVDGQNIDDLNFCPRESEWCDIRVCVRLVKGLHVVRLFNEIDLLPKIDRLVLLAL